VSVFPGENYQAPRSWAERAYHKLIYYNAVAEGGTMLLGNSRSSFHKRFARASDHCAVVVASSVLGLLVIFWAYKLIG
jgi:hypothetical protein